MPVAANRHLDMRPTTLPPRAAARLAEIDHKLAELQAEKRQLDARRQAADRAVRTRQIAIVGGWLLAHDPQKFEQIKLLLTRPQDRAAFGLAPISDTSNPAVSNQNQEQFA